LPTAETTEKTAKRTAHKERRELLRSKMLIPLCSLCCISLCPLWFLHFRKPLKEKFIGLEMPGSRLLAVKKFSPFKGETGWIRIPKESDQPEGVRRKYEPEGVGLFLPTENFN